MGKENQHRGGNRIRTHRSLEEGQKYPSISREDKEKKKIKRTIKDVKGRQPAVRDQLSAGETFNRPHPTARQIRPRSLPSWSSSSLPCRR